MEGFKLIFLTWLGSSLMVVLAYSIYIRSKSPSDKRFYFGMMWFNIFIATVFQAASVIFVMFR